jgi:hypothetical protein
MNTDPADQNGGHDMPVTTDDTPQHDSDGGPETSRTDRGLVDQLLVEELSDARRNYCLAVHQAWVDAAQAQWTAYAEFAAAHHRLVLDAGLRRTSAYQAWLRATQVARPEAANGSLPRPPSAIYHQAIEDASRTQRNEWDQAQEAYRLAVSAVTEAHDAANQRALRIYLTQIQGIWARTDIGSVDAAGLAQLAQASRHAAQAAQALEYRQH